jgi:hypothetical protein
MKPPEVNVIINGPRGRAPAQAYVQAQAQAFPQPPPSMNFPYGYYPSPYMMLPPWYLQEPPPSAPSHFPGQPAPAPTGAAAIEYPAITAWLAYCDRHQSRCGENFSLHAEKFTKEGYRRIDQITHDRISVEKLSSWLSIGKGTADLLIQYAGEDAMLVKAGTFTMFADNS